MNHLITVAASYAAIKSTKKGTSVAGKILKVRQRKSILQVYNELGRNIFRRKFPMHFETFLRLYRVIKMDLWRAMNYNPNNKRGPNGSIHPTIILGCALRVFSGGDPLDLITTFGVSRTVIHYSVDYVINAVCNCKALAIKFPSSHAQQLSIARGFQRKSTAGFNCCVGAVDGMLVWISKPTEKECKQVGVGSGRFFCGRKKKFGLNLQATCDSKKKFLDISIKFPGSCSDFLAFETSALKSRLDSDSFLHPDLCLFGDNAYVNTTFMATPYPNVSRGTKDSYNFYHSQLRINIECAFGILVNRWGILRCPSPQGFTILKVCRMVECLCCLHNYLIDVSNENEVMDNTSSDAFHLQINGAVPLENNTLIPSQLLGASFGTSYDSYEDRRNSIRRRNASQSNLLPREILHTQIIESD